MSKEELWRETILSVSATIQNAVQVLNTTAMKIVLVTDISGVLIGTVSDGDIRRGLVGGATLESTLESVVNREPITVSTDLSKREVFQLMRTHDIQQIPIVDINQKVIGLHAWNEVSGPISRNNTIVIMAGGRGTRLHPQTEHCPKPLLPVAGKPIIQHIIEAAKAQGFSHFVLAIHHLGNLIEEYCGNGDRFGVKIDYLREVLPLGTAGALSLFETKSDFPIIVTNGDLITDISYSEIIQFHEKQQAIATMAVRIQEWQNPYGVVKTDGFEITGYEEKPIIYSQVNAGVYVISPPALDALAKSVACDMPTLFKALQDKGERTVAFPVHERWVDVGQPRDLEYIRLNF
jgi:dTDP-glucose pyrophosphorylase